LVVPDSRNRETNCSSDWASGRTVAAPPEVSTFPVFE
jgi:hypothetical protein